VRNEVIGDEFEHRGKQCLLLAWHASHGFEAGAPMPEGIDSAFETDPGKIDLMPDGSFLHQRANQVVGNGVHHDFLFHHCGGLAAQHVHAEGDFDFTEVKFDAPALKTLPGLSVETKSKQPFEIAL